jgi:hypothetical protein
LFLTVLIVDLEVWLPTVLQVLVDPVPEARWTATKALGTLVREIHFPVLVPGLLRALKTDSSGVDQQLKEQKV